MNKEGKQKKRRKETSAVKTSYKADISTEQERRSGGIPFLDQFIWHVRLRQFISRVTPACFNGRIRSRDAVTFPFGHPLILSALAEKISPRKILHNLNYRLPADAPAEEPV